MSSIQLHLKASIGSIISIQDLPCIAMMPSMCNAQIILGVVWSQVFPSGYLPTNFRAGQAIGKSRHRAKLIWAQSAN